MSQEILEELKKINERLGWLEERLDNVESTQIKWQTEQLQLTQLNASGTTQFDGPVLVNNRDITEDGVNLEVHSSNIENPHNVTTEQINALNLDGGIVGGNVNIKKELTVNGGLRIPDAGVEAGKDLWVKGKFTAFKESHLKGKVRVDGDIDSPNRFHVVPGAFVIDKADLVLRGRRSMKNNKSRALVSYKDNLTINFGNDFGRVEMGGVLNVHGGLKVAGNPLVQTKLLGIGRYDQSAQQEISLDKPTHITAFAMLTSIDPAGDFDKHNHIYISISKIDGKAYSKPTFSGKAKKITFSISESNQTETHALGVGIVICH